MFDFKNASNKERKKEYKRIANEIGDDQFFTKKELKYLPEILMENEQVLAFSSGVMDGNTWLITLTNERVIFLDKGILYGLKQTTIDLEKINAISGSTGLVFGKIIINDGYTERQIKNVWKKTVRLFTNKVQEAIEAKKSKRGASQAVNEESGYEKLEKLASLRDKGIISEEEFVIEKKKILELS